MWLFNRKKKNTDILSFAIPEPEHQCILKDMPWYMTTKYSGKDKIAEYSIIEPYICINGCGYRKDVVLEHESWTNIDPDTREEFYDKVRKRYKKYLRPRAVVEDMINNILLVKDPAHLEQIEIMRGLPHRNVGTSAEMKQELKDMRDTDKQPKIEVEEEK